MRFIDKQQAKLAVASAEQKWKTYLADQKAIDKLEKSFEKDMALLTRGVRAQVRQFQTYLDYFFGFGFRRDRAFDLYTLADPPEVRKFRFHYGYIHPDDEENAYFALGRHDAKLVLDLAETYRDSISLKNFDPAYLSAAFKLYTDGLGEHHVLWSFTEPDILASFRAGGVTTLPATFTEVPSDHKELKIEQVCVSLEGAKAKNGDPIVSVTLEHRGDAENRRRDGTIASTTAAPPRHDTIDANFKQDDVSSLDEDTRRFVWGRSPITMWRLSVEKASADNLDLSGLSEIQLGVRYKYYDPNQAKKKPKPRKPISRQKPISRKKVAGRAIAKKTTKR